MSERFRPPWDPEAPKQPWLRIYKVMDYTYAFRGTWDTEPEGDCRVRILEADNRIPVLLITEVARNTSTSITNMIEVLAAELIASHMPERFEVPDEDPVVLIEHYPPRKQPDGQKIEATYDRVGFASWVPRRVWLGGQARLSLEGPDWCHLPTDEVEHFIGHHVEDESTI